MRRRGRVTIGGAGLAAIAVVALLASGCGYGGVATASSGDPSHGKTLFTTNCGGCHALLDAGTKGTIGPNLDNAFAGDRIQLYAQSSIENLVLDQIRLGSGPIATYTNAEHGLQGLTPQPEMPPNLVKGQDALDVAAYVASVAGLNGFATAAGYGKTGAEIFTGPAGCAGCHALKAAGSTGASCPAGAGCPNLDQIASQLTLAIVTHQVEQGGGVMPSFTGKLSAAQIQAVAQYVVANAGK